MFCILTLCSIAALLDPHPTQKNAPEEELLHLASEGIDLRTALSRWLEIFKAWQTLDSTKEDDSRSKFANVYFHAISIYLSGHFDYRYQFNHILSASLPSKEIDVHVREILQHTEEALKTTRLAGILFLFPLRVAGARARTAVQRLRILEMLDGISDKSFVVAHAFSEDLKDLWKYVAL
jgi:hypothetical protein